MVHNLDPDRPELPERDPDALRAARNREAALLAVASPHLDRLDADIGGDDAIVFLADRHAMVLGQRTDRSHDIWRRDAGQVVGSYYQERAIGSCAVGTCIAERRPIMLGPGQHFLALCSAVTAVAAPIFGPDGQLVGTIGCADAHARGASRARLFLMAAISVARHIETELFALAFPKTRLMMASRGGRERAGLVAIAGDERVVGATREARAFLGLSEERLASGCGCRDVLEPPEDLARAETRLIGQALMRHGNNRSAVARALGISRSTLYRKLAERRTAIVPASTS